MLKRYQVLLTHWLGDHLKQISEKYDISFSEAIRLVLCLQIPKLASIAHPKCAMPKMDKELVDNIKKAGKKGVERAKFHNLVSKIYFESRKSIECWEEEEKKQKNRLSSEVER